MKKKYTMELSKAQLETISKALEFYSRFMAGQWEIPDDLQFNEYEIHNQPKNFWNKRNNSEDIMKLAKRTFFDHLCDNESYAIGSNNLHENAKIAYDIYRPILELFHKEAQNVSDEDRSYSVYAYPGSSYSKEGRVEIKTSDDYDTI